MQFLSEIFQQQSWGFNFITGIVGISSILSCVYMSKRIEQMENELQKAQSKYEILQQRIKKNEKLEQARLNLNLNNQNQQKNQIESQISQIQITCQQLEKIMNQQIVQVQYSYFGMNKEILDQEKSQSPYRIRKSFLQNIKISLGPQSHSSHVSPNKYSGLDDCEQIIQKNDKNVYIHRQYENVNLNPPINYARNLSNIDRENIARICVTGGHCAGKTTAIAAIKQDLTQLGIKVLVAPEGASLLMNGGANIVQNKYNINQGLQFQKTLLKLQVALEESMIDIAKLAGSSYEVVVLIDRGLMDGSAYVTHVQWQAILDDLGVSTPHIRDNRYDAVIHMVTAADGAETFYNNNLSTEQQYESIEDAKIKDELLRQAYMGHQRWFLIKNNECLNFKDKIQKAQETVLNVLGKSAGKHFHKKLLLKKEQLQDDSAFPLDLSKISQQFYEEVYITQVFIDYKSSVGEVVSCSVEKKGSQNSFSYTHTLTLLQNGQKLFKKKIISAAEYIHYKSQIKKGTQPLRYKRICMIDNGIYIIVDYFSQIDGAPMLGIIQVKNENQSIISLPNYIKVLREVTDEPQYQTEIMCKENYYMDQKDKDATSSPKDIKKLI